MTTELTELFQKGHQHTQAENKEDTFSTSDLEQDEKRSKWWTVLGYISVFSLATHLAISTSCAQCLGGSVPLFELNLSRFLVAVIGFLPAVIYKKASLHPGKSRSQQIALFVYCCAGLGYNLTYFEASKSLSVGTLSGLESSFVLIFASAIQTAFFIRKCFLNSIISVLICLAGIPLITQPAFLFGSDSHPHTRPLCVIDQHTGDSDSETRNISLWNNASDTNQSFSQTTVPPVPYVIASTYQSYLLALCSACMYIIQIFTTRHLRDMNSFALLLWKGVFGVLISAAIMLAVEVPTFPKSQPCVALLFSHSIGAGLADLSFVVAVVLLPPITFSILVNLTLVFLLCGQYTVLRDVNPGHHNVLEAVGMILVLVACVLEPVYTLYKNWRERESQKNDKQPLIHQHRK